MFIDLSNYCSEALKNKSQEQLRHPSLALWAAVITNEMYFFPLLLYYSIFF